MTENTQQTASTAPIYYCRVCGRALSLEESRNVHGAIYCVEHAPTLPYTRPMDSRPFEGHPQEGRYMEPPSPYTSPLPPAANTSPGLAFLVGLIPGVGAVYNAQYVKAIVHVVVLGLLISIISSSASAGFEPLFGMLIGIWYFYMPFEAYHTARKRQLGLPVDDLSSILPMSQRTAGVPVGPIILIALGVIFLLAQFELVSFAAILRFWPVALIVAGAWMLYERMSLKRSES